MINEGEAGEGGGEEGGVGGVGAALGDAPALGDALDQPGVIQVSPQDKEAIERVRFQKQNSYWNYFYPFPAESAGFPWTPGGSGEIVFIINNIFLIRLCVCQKREQKSV